MSYVYGPVPSRRLGQSLGIDPIPFKTCNWNCVYCQLGRTCPVRRERRDYLPPERIVAEVAERLAQIPPGAIDWVTFVGSGEPTLHASLGRMLREVRDLTSVPVAVITNGALLWRPEVREELAEAEAVMPTVDAGTPALYRRINRPHPELTFERLVEGLIRFRDLYRGRLWVEVMLVRDLNDTPEALADLAAVLHRIAPDEIHLTLPIRPPAETWVEPSDQTGVRRAAEALGATARILPPAGGELDLSDGGDLLDAVAGILIRHPVAEDELLEALGRWAPAQVNGALVRLEAEGRARPVTRYGRRFWSAAAAVFPDPRH